MKLSYILLLLVVVLSGCAPSGSSTLFKIQETLPIQKIGFTDCSVDSSFKPTGLTTTNSTFLFVFPNACNDHDIDSVQYCTELFDYNTPDAASVKRLCFVRGLDAVFVSSLKFLAPSVSAKYSNGFVDIETEMKLVDKHGRLVVMVRNTTKGTISAGGIKKQEELIEHSIRGAVKRMAKELKSLTAK
ncbi:MAG: hypothetical protein JNJ85_02470 [Candidatus Kapabacteria bacterium]|nr:hypothetical protein [Candidatus Kapabacteria bacterium]